MPTPRPPARTPRFTLPSGGPSSLDRAIRWGLLAVVVALGIWTLPHWPNAWRWVTGREPLFVPEHEPNLGGVDLQAVHRMHWGTWVVAASRAIPGVPDEDLDQARATMREAIGADANLQQIFDELDGIVSSDRLRGERSQKRSLWLGRAWNHYLDRQGEGFFVHTGVIDGTRPMFYAHVYAVVGDAQGTLADESYRIRAVSRLDQLNLREAYLGYASNADEGAVIVTERVVEFALDRLWPLLDEQGGDRLAQVFAPMVVAEVRRSLPAETFETLTRTAAVRRRVVATYDAIMDRRECSRMWVPHPPWSGYPREHLDQLSSHVGVGPCANIHGDELTTLWKASEELQALEGLQEATERLAAWAARPVALHELRHVADDTRYDRDEPRPCGPCISSDPPVVRSEAAAYVAELAWAQAPAAALYQVCETTSSGRGAHARAREVVMQGLRARCLDGVPAELTQAARALEAESFVHAEAIALPEGFPQRLPVVAARDLEPELAP